MEASKRERIVLLGIAPVASAIVGAVCTVFVQRWFGATTADALTAVANASTLSPADKLKALDAINKNDQQFYEFIRTLLLYLGAPIMVLAMSLGARIRG